MQYTLIPSQIGPWAFVVEGIAGTVDTGMSLPDVAEMLKRDTARKVELSARKHCQLRIGAPNTPGLGPDEYLCPGLEKRSSNQARAIVRQICSPYTVFHMCSCTQGRSGYGGGGVPWFQPPDCHITKQIRISVWRRSLVAPNIYVVVIPFPFFFSILPPRDLDLAS